MSESFPPTDRDPDHHEQFPPLGLLEYFRDQFSDAYDKQKSELGMDFDKKNGDFVRGVPLEERDIQPSLLRQSDRIILKPPHPRDIPGYYCEVYAIFDREKAIEEEDDRPGSKALSFIVRDFTNGRPGRHLLANENGVFDIDLKVDSRIGVSGLENTDFLQPVLVAESMLRKYLEYNIVASED